MMYLRVVLFRLVLTIALALGLAAPVGAAAQSRPHVSLSLPAVIEAGSPFPAQWQGRGVPRGARVLVQKPVGTARVWRPLARALAGTRGSVTLPAYGGLGIYRLRIAVLRHGKVLASQERQAHVFGTVPLEDLVPGAEANVLATAHAAFPYIRRYSMGITGSPIHEASASGVISTQRSACDLIHIDLVGEPEEKDRPGTKTATATIVQQSAEPTTTTVPMGEAGAVEAHVALGQSWALNLTVKLISGEIFGRVFVNGSAHCDAKTPFVLS